eukprot:280569_1
MSILNWIMGNKMAAGRYVVSTHTDTIVSVWCREVNCQLSLALCEIISKFASFTIDWDQSLLGNASYQFEKSNRVKICPIGKWVSTTLFTNYPIDLNANFYKNHQFKIEFEMNLFSTWFEWGFIEWKKETKKLVLPRKDTNLRIHELDGAAISHWSTGGIRVEAYSGAVKNTLRNCQVKNIGSGDKIMFQLFCNGEKSCKLFVNGVSQGMLFQNLPDVIVPCIAHPWGEQNSTICTVRYVE